ncbi:SDR family NAD(P)-dependent oxidoreductase [Herpetosiphon geysericola]|uniref:Short-chain dehydrogenase n=1 Tax=Herpetosiphon geysericola TaxID=70996 RepID=A0A0P6YE48_9CHLR|nr:SDR family oxidoreductase [Herpetosiphon geysericola]KPL90375.1 short-chain dehydrogenase [Herpetosiphon geysericola]
MQRIGLITGASRGLGLALAQKLALDGWHLIITGRGATALEQARAALASSTSVQAIAGDIADPAHRQALAIAAQEWGGLDLLVNNASILGPSPLPSLVEYPLDQLAQVYAINVFAPLAAIQTLTPSFKPSIRIINISSDAALQPYEGWGGYGSSKAALDQVTAILAAEQPTWRVYSLDPGDMNTQMHQEAFLGEDISDRPPPEASVPAILRLINDDVPSGRYRKE